VLYCKQSRPRSLLVGGGAVAAFAAMATAAIAASRVAAGAQARHAGMDHAHHLHQQATGGTTAADPHAHHRAMMMHPPALQRSVHRYRLPDAKLIGTDGKETTLRKLLGGGKPVLVDFIFTTCTTICPVLSATFTQVQARLGKDRNDVRLVSISIDPEEDTPERLRAYADRYHAGPEWGFFTGDRADIIAIQKAFEVYRGNKMSHEPTILLRDARSEPWVRLDGLASAADVMKAYALLTGAVNEQETPVSSGEAVTDRMRRSSEPSGMGSAPVAGRWTRSCRTTP
jgi:protein SCO1/2